MKRIVLIGGVDSIGVPYSRDNKKHVGFFEMLEEHLQKDNEVTTINCFHMSTNNDNKYIKRILTEDITLYDVKISQNAMLKKCKYSGIYPFLEMPKSFLEHYQVNEDDKNIMVKDILKNNEAIFVYSAFVNDLLKSRNLSLFKLLNPQKINKELKSVNIDFVLEGMEENVVNLIKLNRKIKIYIIGLFIPTKINLIRDSLKDFIISVNKEFKKIADKYPKNVIFVNNENLVYEDFNNIDFHPNKKGHLKIYNNLLEELKK